MLGRQIAQWKSIDPHLLRIVPGLSIYDKRDGQTVTRKVGLVRQHIGCANGRGRMAASTFRSSISMGMWGSSSGVSSTRTTRRRMRRRCNRCDSEPVLS
jgi:hypothetical protein